MPRIEPRAADWEAQMLPLRYASPKAHTLVDAVAQSSSSFTLQEENEYLYFMSNFFKSWLLMSSCKNAKFN